LKTKITFLGVFLMTLFLAATWFSPGALAKDPNAGEWMAPEGQEKNKVVLEFFVFQEQLTADQLSPGIEICLVNQDDETTDLLWDPDEGEDQIVVSFAWGPEDYALTEDPESIVCSSMDPDWECEGVTVDGPMAYLSLHPVGTATMGPGDTVCFLLENVQVNANEGYVGFMFDQRINKDRAKKPINDFDYVFKTIVGMDADTLDGYEGEDFMQEIDELWEAIYELQAQIAAIEDLLQHFSRVGNNVQITGANLHILNGTGNTESTNSVGNLIVGYGQSSVSGSHNIMVGQANNATSYGGIVAGETNRISAPYSMVVGGYYNTASDSYAGVYGGYRNSATYDYASVHGGYYNTARDTYATVHGGYRNTAAYDYSSVHGGIYNRALYYYASCHGGYYNSASGYYSSTHGGYYNRATYYWSSTHGGYYNSSSGFMSSVSGGYYNRATGGYSSINGGYYNYATGYYSSVLGGYRNSASGYYATVSGGYYNRATYYYATAAGGYYCTASGRYSAVSGGSRRAATGTYDWRGGTYSSGS
jgi:hypothetical protein